MLPFNAVIFDMDGLLLDSEVLALQAFRKTCSMFQLPCQQDVFNRLIGTSRESGMQILKKDLAGLVDIDAFAKHWDSEYNQITSENPIPLKPGVKLVLTQLSGHGIKTAVATSTETHQATEKLTRSGVFDYFHCVVGGDQAIQSKPDPEIYLRTAEKLGQPVSACLALEDSDNGVRSALAAGMTVVQIPDLVEPGPELIELGHIVLDDLLDVLHFDFASYLREKH